MIFKNVGYVVVVYNMAASGIYIPPGLCLYASVLCLCLRACVGAGVSGRVAPLCLKRVSMHACASIRPAAARSACASWFFTLLCGCMPQCSRTFALHCSYSDGWETTRPFHYFCLAGGSPCIESTHGGDWSSVKDIDGSRGEAKRRNIQHCRELKVQNKANSTSHPRRVEVQQKHNVIFAPPVSLHRYEPLSSCGRQSCTHSVYR